MRGKASSLHGGGDEGMDGVRYETFRNAVLRIHPEAEEKDIKAAYTLAEGQRDVLSAALKRLRGLKKGREELGLVEVIPKVILTTLTAQLVRKGLKKIEKEEGGEEGEKKRGEEEEVKEKGRAKGKGMGGGEDEGNKMGENKIKELIKDVQNYVKKIIHSKRACYLASVYAKKKLKDYNPVIVYGDVHKDRIKVKNHAWLIITVKGKKWIYDPTIKKFVKELPILIPLEEGEKYWKVRGLLEELRRKSAEREKAEEKYKSANDSAREERRGVSETGEEGEAAILWL